MNTDMLQKAIEIAVDGHRGQVDKSGELYILHPMRVMGAFQENNRRIVGLLHDVLEDTHYVMEDLVKSGFSNEIRDAVDALTKREAEPYEVYLGRVKDNKMARDVKLADLADNMGRIDRLPEPDFSRLHKKYKTAHDALKRP